MSPAGDQTAAQLVGGGGLVAALSAVAIAVDRVLTGRRRDRNEAAKNLADQTVALMAQAVSLADERRDGEHDCRAELAVMKGELVAMRAEHRMETTEIRAELAECKRRHEMTDAKLNHGDFPNQHGGESTTDAAIVSAAGAVEHLARTINPDRSDP